MHLTPEEAAKQSPDFPTDDLTKENYPGLRHTQQANAGEDQFLAAGCLDGVRLA